MSTDLQTRYDELVAERHLQHDPHQQHVIEMFDALDAKLEAYDREDRKRGIGSWFSSPAVAPKGLYIHGGVGRGKTMLMDLFFEQAPISPKLRVHFHEFMQDVHEKVHHFRQHTSKGYVKDENPIPKVADEIARKAKLLCLDEFQVTDITDAMILGRLFSALFDRGIVVVATSNRHPDTLYEHGLNRALFLPFIAMLKDRMDVVALDGDTDHRLRQLNGMDVYYTPLGEATDKRMREAWEQITNVERGEPAELEIKGRRIDVPEAAKGVARFGFADLCEKPLGAADYLKIARRYHTVLLERIPAMGPEKRNEARRFVNLIDTLYNARVKLVASAATAPDDIYKAGDGTFEFARTVSRLFEMQSEEYLALGHCT